MIHTHPWDFTSYVVSGHVENVRYLDIRGGAMRGIECLRQAILCGEGGGLKGEPEPAFLATTSPTGEPEFAREIHESRPSRGAVTLVRRRVPRGGSPDRAFVYWAADASWVSAEPRPAEPHEVAEICSAALEAGWA